MPFANAFQHGIDEVREMMPGLCGKRVTCDKDHAFTGLWDGPQEATGTITGVHNDGNFVALAQFDGEGVSKLTSSSLMLCTTKWGWETHNRRYDNRPTPEGQKHKLSMTRAYAMIITIAGCADMEHKYIFILDGNGENRCAIENALDDLRVPESKRPTVITLEKDPNVALANALRFGRKHVRLTTGDFRMQTTKNQPCGIERSIILDGHSVLSEHEKRNCIGLYLDYCGSPPKHVPFSRLYAALPQLVCCAITVAKRQPDAHRWKMLMERAAPTGFIKVNEFSHPRVRCNMYLRAPGGPMTGLKRDHIAQAQERVRRKRAAPQQAEMAPDLSGTTVAIPAGLWPGGQPVGYEGVRCCGDRLLFVVTKPHYKYWALNARMADGTQHPVTENFTLTRKQVLELAVAAEELSSTQQRSCAKMPRRV